MCVMWKQWGQGIKWSIKKTKWSSRDELQWNFPKSRVTKLRFLKRGDNYHTERQWTAISMQVFIITYGKNCLRVSCNIQIPIYFNLLCLYVRIIPWVLTIGTIYHEWRSVQIKKKIYVNKKIKQRKLNAILIACYFLSSQS